MSRIDSKSLSSLIDQALSGNFLNLADTLHRFSAIPQLDVVAHRYPPSNVSMVDDNTWLVELAVAGFSEDDLKVTLDEKENVLTVSGQQAITDSESSVRYIKRGIGLRNFTERYALADNTKVEGVKLVNGLLQIMIKREVPEKLAYEPKVLQIVNASKAPALTA